jgi:protein-serine/threonine kinase
LLEHNRFYASEVLSALEYLHLMGIVYRDLKPENVFIKEDGHIMLTDFYSSFIADVIPTRLEVGMEDKATGSRSSGIEVTSRLETVTSHLLPVKFPKKKKKPRKDKRAQYLNTSIPEVIQAEPTTARSMSIVGTYEYLAPEMIEGKGYGSSVDWWAFGIFIYELLFGKTPFRGPDDFQKPVKFPESVPVSSAAKDLIKRLLMKDPKLRLAYNGGAIEIKQHPFFHGINWALLRYSNRPPVVPGPYYGHDDDGFEDYDRQ